MKLQLIAIKTRDKVYISDNIENKSYFNSRIEEYLFDDKSPISTHKKDWFEIKSIPVNITTKDCDRYVNQRFVLKDEYKSLNLDETCFESDWYANENNEQVFYEKKYDIIPGEWIDVEFEINVISELDDFEIIRQDYKPKYNILDEIRTHPILLSERPCKLSKQETFDIIRKYIKLHIDNSVATITSDYDFCFSVKKRIKLLTDKEIITNFPFSKRKSKVSKTNVDLVTCFEMAPKAYQTYPIVDEFTGSNYKNLEFNIKLYLEELMMDINTPLTECPHCNGKGYIND
jgi:hypothetical protein